jgi:hypothetical protein
MLSDGVAIVGQILAGGFERYRLSTAVDFRLARQNEAAGAADAAA